MILGVSSGQWYYGLAVMMLVIGFSVFVWSLFSGITGLTSGLIQIIGPGASELNLNEAGEYTVFYENQSYVDGRFFSTGDNISCLQIEIIEKSTGSRLSTYSPPSSLTYSMGGRFGKAIPTFQVRSPGIISLERITLLDTRDHRWFWRLGHGFMEGILSTVAISLVVFFGSLIIAAALAITTYKKGIKHKSGCVKRSDWLGVNGTLIERDSDDAII